MSPDEPDEGAASFRCRLGFACLIGGLAVLLMSCIGLLVGVTDWYLPGISGLGLVPLGVIVIMEQRKLGEKKQSVDL
ncbi:MAG: hypothetical protein QOG97_3701 [Acidimicrobiaceae bacterium]|jgi:hypothetical protein|nr:hypothetical protein [Acidimicrobiaceae bacterium]